MKGWPSNSGADGTQAHLAKKFVELGSFTWALSPQELSDHIRREQNLWAPIIDQVGTKQQ